ncbi:MAG TPA: DUF4249 domain-containing protein [Agriterribacter sp.]|nr:DUF4249 domain-containing protein [Agriterribacter sp.]
MKSFCYMLLCIVFLSAASCKEKYDLPQTVANKDYLVVEGFIDGGNDSTFITLSRTVTPGDTTQIKMEQGAIVSVEGESGENFGLNEIAAGQYATAPLPLNPQGKYRLAITTRNGKAYQSDYVDVKKTPAIDSISWSREPNGVQLYVNTHDDENQTKYYNWEYDETWEYYSFYYSIWEYKNGTMDYRNNPNLLFRCWQSYKSSNIIIGSSAKLSKDIIYNQPISFIPDDSWKLSSRYSIIVKQRALSKGAYEYLQNVKKNSEQLGSIFDPQPSTSNGNIHCMSDAQETVLGYVYSSTLVEKRIFITASEVKDWKYHFWCEQEISVKNDPDSLKIYFEGQLYIPTTEIRVGPFIESYKASTRFCVDCTVRGGSSEKPDFW